MANLGIESDIKILILDSNELTILKGSSAYIIPRKHTKVPSTLKHTSTQVESWNVIVWLVLLSFSSLLQDFVLGNCCPFSLGPRKTYMEQTWAPPLARNQAQLKYPHYWRRPAQLSTGQITQPAESYVGEQEYMIVVLSHWVLGHL